MGRVADQNQTEFVVDSEFVVRTPLRPLESMLADAEPGDDDARGRWIMRQAVDPEVRESLSCASPSLVEALDRDAVPGSDVLRATHRYLVRMSSRSTLFGLFAGTSTGEFGAESCLDLGNAAARVRRSTPHAPHLFEIASGAIERGAWAELPCSINSTLVASHDGVDFLHDAGQGPEAMHVAGEEVLAVVAAARRLGADFCPRACAQALAEDDPEQQSAWLEFIGQLLEHGALLSHGEPAVSGDSLAAQIDVALGRARADKERRAVASITRAVSALDEQGLVPSQVQRARVHAAYRDGLGRVPSHLADVHLLKTKRLIAPSSVRQQVVTAVDVLTRFGVQPCDPAVGRLKACMVEAFGERRVPLLQCFDLISGLPLAPAGNVPTHQAPLLSDIPFVAPPVESRAPWTARDALLIGWLERLWRDGETTLQLDGEDYGRIEPVAPLSSAVLRGALVGRPDDPRLYVKSLVGPGGAELFAQTRHVDPRVDAIARRHLEHERIANADVIVAELVQRAEPQADAVTRRPSSEGYELVCLGRSAVEPGYRIDVADLDVVVEDDEIRLYSRRLGWRVVVRVSCNHDYLNAPLPLYRMLGLLQRQEAARYHRWSWGPMKDCARLPRVCVGSTILAPQQWRIDRPTLDRLTPGHAIAWAEQQGLARFVWLVSVEPPLRVDLADSMAVEGLLHATAGASAVTLTECIFAEEGSAVQGHDGCYANELLVPLYRPATTRPAIASAVRVPPAASSTRWLYVRVAGNPNALQKTLATSLGSVVQRLRRAPGCSAMHFVFYDEPRFHLRVRLRGEHSWLRTAALGELWAAVEPLMQSGTVWGFELDDYLPEVERYGGTAGLQIAEQIFDADSRAVLSMRQRCADDPSGAPPWHWCLRSVDRLLEDLDYDDLGRAALIETLAASRRREFGDTVALRRAIGQTHRRYRAELDAFATEAHGTIADDPIERILALRGERLKPCRERLSDLARRGRLGVTVDGFVTAVVHMHVNRTLPLCSRAQELVLYGLLHRAYVSRRARRSAPTRAMANRSHSAPPRGTGTK